MHEEQTLGDLWEGRREREGGVRDRDQEGDRDGRREKGVLQEG